jgi:hypothetical protein
MHLFSGPLLLVCAGFLFAQAEDPEIISAKAELARIRTLVEIGAAPRNQLAKAEDGLADAQDAAILRKTAYGQDLSLDQSDEMIAAAGRRIDRRQKLLDDAQRLVKAGVATQLSLETLSDDLARARKEGELAESRAQVTREISEMALSEEALASRSAIDAAELGEQYSGDGTYAFATFAKVEVAYEEHFGKKMPVSALGETAVHRALGFDHRGRVDVALNPDQPEGAWLLEYLRSAHIPFFAFRHAVPGKATGAHIHIGPTSTRISAGG